MKKGLLFLFIILFVMEGCDKVSEQKDVSEMDSKDLPKATAFQDDFTKEFMASTKEVADGYYLFKSKTGGYTMWYPEDAKMDKTYYEKNKNIYELIDFGGEREKVSGMPYFITMTYDNKKNTSDIESYLSLLSTKVHYNGRYQKDKLGQKTIYYAYKKHTTQVEGKTSVAHIFFAFIKSNESNQALTYEYNVINNNPEKDQSIDIGAIKDEAGKIIKTVKFQ